MSPIVYESLQPCCYLKYKIFTYKPDLEKNKWFSRIK